MSTLVLPPPTRQRSQGADLGAPSCTRQGSPRAGKPKSAPRPTTSSPPRNYQYGRLAQAKKQLGLDEVAYREFLRGQGAREIDGTPSAKTLSFGALTTAANLLSRQAGIGKLNRRNSDHPQIRKLRAMWIEGAKAGTIRDRSDRALVNFIRRFMANKQAPISEITQPEARAAIKALQQMTRAPTGSAELYSAGGERSEPPTNPSTQQ